MPVFPFIGSDLCMSSTPRMYTLGEAPPVQWLFDSLGFLCASLICTQALQSRIIIAITICKPTSLKRLMEVQQLRYSE